MNRCQVFVLSIGFEFFLFCASYYLFLSQVMEPNGEQSGDEQNGEDGSQEEAVVVDADSTDGAVLVNGNEAEEEWGTNNEGTPSA